MAEVGSKMNVKKRGKIKKVACKNSIVKDGTEKKEEREKQEKKNKQKLKYAENV